MRYFFALIISTLTINTYAITHQVHGRLKDASTKEVIEFATIVVSTNENDSVVTSLITDSRGEFVFNIEPGQYHMDIRFLGYKTIHQRISVESQNLYLNTILMEIDDNKLQAVNITASSYTEQFDRSVQTVTKDFKAGTNNVNDLLSKIRGISIDPLDNSIRVDNEENVLLLVDGVKKEQAYIKKLPPDRVSRIEVSRNPTGRYISEGYSSVINIILKKNFSGYNIYLEEQSFYSLDQSNGDDVLFKNMASIDLTYSIKKVNVYGSYAHTKSNTNVTVENLKQLGEEGLVKEPITEPNSIRDGLSHNWVLGTDLFLTPSQSLSLETNIIHSPISKNSTNRSYNNILNVNDGKEIFESALLNEQSENTWYSQLAYRYKISENNRVELDYAYNINESKQRNLYTETTGNEMNQRLNTRRNASIFDVNFNHQFNKTYALDVGYKNVYRSYKYNYLSLTGEKSTETNKDIRNLLYAYLSYTPKGKVKAKAGFALEQNILKTAGQTNYNNSVQPYLSINYKQSKKLSITLNINSQSEYPYASQINPNELTIDRFTHEVGNPYLNYSTSYTSSLDFKLFKNKLSIEPFYSYTNNFISKTGELEDDYFLYSYSNLDKHESYGVKMSTKLSLIPKKMFFNLTASYNNDRTEYGNHNNSIKDYNINSNVLFLSGRHKTLYALMFKKMNAKKIQAHGYFNNDNDYLGCIVKQPFFKGKMAVTFLYILPVEWGVSYSMEDYFEYDTYKDHTTTRVGLLKNLFMAKISFSIDKGNEVKSIDKKDFKEKKQTKGFF